MKIRVGPISIFNILIILILITLTFNSYKQSQATQSLISQNLDHNITYLQARSQINHFINDCQKIPLTKLQEQYDFQVDDKLITYQVSLDFGQTLNLRYNYQSGQIITLQVSNDTDYQVDDKAPVYTGE